MASLSDKQRNPWLDYLKAFAIYMVIVGHAISNCMVNGSASRVNGIIYFIHIPLFLVISGSLVKDKNIDAKFWFCLTKRFVVPYTVWTIILTTFYQGAGHLLHDGVAANVEVYFSNWCHSFLWFIKAYLVAYILWQILQRWSCWWRLAVGSALLVATNVLTQDNKPLAEIASLSLYSYTLFGTGACVRKYMEKMNACGIVMLVVVFLFCLPFAVPENNYFSCSFGHMLQYGDWYVFFIRLVAGTSISMALISIGRILGFIVTPPHGLLSGIGKHTLQIYMLQSLLVEAVLNRLICVSDEFYGFMACFGIAIVMTVFCHVIIKSTMKYKLCRNLLWGM